MNKSWILNIMKGEMSFNEKSWILNRIASERSFNEKKMNIE
jgi:hypothetical protein